jgi:hypothetical protein
MVTEFEFEPDDEVTTSLLPGQWHVIETEKDDCGRIVIHRTKNDVSVIIRPEFLTLRSRTA